jgi:transposase
MARKAKKLELTKKDQKELQELSRSGTLKARKLNRCRILLLKSQGKTLDEIANVLNMSKVTVNQICQRYEKEGLQAALNERPRAGKPSIFSGQQKAKITALACSNAPEGRSQWSLRLLADKAVELKLVESISHTEIGRILKKTKSNRT